MRAMSRRVDEDGVVRTRRERSRAPWLLGAAILFALVAVAAAWWVAAPEAPSSEGQLVEAPVIAEERARPRVRIPVGTSISPERAAELAQFPEEGSGLALFRPGTKPIKVGIVVPEGFDLPPGYVRHYQTMDDGRQLPAILMFHPDHRPVDAEGRALELPVDRIVPPELAPPGLSLEVLQVPEPLAEPAPSERGDGE